MQLAIAEVNAKLVETGAAALEMGIGIHTGRVIVGNIGSLRRTKYAAVGSNVNLAGRIESFTTGGQLLISETTRGKIQSPLRIDGEFQVEPKGASGKIQLYEIGGMGEPYNLSLPLRSSVLHQLEHPLPVQITTLEEKFVGHAVYGGQFTAISATEARMESELSLAPLSNLRITLEHSTVHPGGEIYAKVIETQAGTPCLSRIRFTSISPYLKAWLRNAASSR
jgi:adenylate cyclase